MLLTIIKVNQFLFIVSIKHTILYTLTNIVRNEITQGKYQESTYRDHVTSFPNYDEILEAFNIRKVI